MGKRVLIVNDSRFEGLVLKDSITRLGHDAKLADEFDAVRMIEVFKPDFLVVNLIMKETRGDIFIANIKWRFPNIQCILTSCNDIDKKDYDTRLIASVFKTPIGLKELEGALL